MHKWLKIEDKINHALEAFGAFLLRLLLAITPRPIQERCRRLMVGFRLLRKRSKAKIIQAFQRVMADILQKWERFSAALDKTFAFLARAKHIDIRKLDRKKVWLSIVAFVTPLVTRIKSSWAAITPAKVMGYSVYVGATVIGGVAIMNIYTASQKINKAGSERTPASLAAPSQVGTSPATSTRPAYYKVWKRQFLVSGINMPIHIETSSSIKSLILDLELQASNRYIRKFFVENEHLLKDRLNNSLEAIVPEFPLTPEGKTIIKDKIIREVNGLIHELKIKGEIENVLFHNIISA